MPLNRAGRCCGRALDLAEEKDSVAAAGELLPVSEAVAEAHPLEVDPDRFEGLDLDLPVQLVYLPPPPDGNRKGQTVGW